MDGTVRIRSMVWFATGVVTTLLVTAVVMQTWRAGAAPGDADATLVPITPCRLLDTRPPTTAVFGAGETRTLTAHGVNGACNIPNDAVALSLNVTALGATAPDTFLTIWEDGVARPNASSLNPAPGQPPTPNAVTTPLSATGRFNVFNFSGTVDVLIDVNGYYTKSSLQEIATRLAAVETGVAANAATIAAIDAREPFAVSARTAAASPNQTPAVIASVEVMAPVAGHVAVTSTTNAGSTTAGTLVTCSITTPSSPPAIDGDYAQIWDAAALAPSPGGTFSQLAGTRVFPVAAGATSKIDLVCRKSDDTSFTLLSDTVLTAIFTPSP